MQYACGASAMAKGMAGVTLAVCLPWSCDGQGGGVGA